MYTFGSTTNHGNGLEFTNGSTNAFTGDFTVGFWIRTLALAGAGDRVVIACGAAPGTPTDGWNIYMENVADRYQFTTGDGVSDESDLIGAAVTVDGLVHSLVFSYDTSANLIELYENGSLTQLTATHNTDPSASAQLLAIGCNLSGANGHACNMGQIAIWNDSVADISIGETLVTQFYEGDKYLMPAQGSLVLWDKGLDNLGYDEIEEEAASTVNGTVTQVSHAIDYYYRGAGYITTWDLAAWLPPLLAAGNLFGGNLLCEAAQVWKAIQKIKGTVCRGFSKEEVNSLIREMQAFRKPREFYFAADYR